MSEQIAVVAPTGLSQTERLVDTFVAPSKTFADIFRSRSWWLPFLLLVVCSYALTGAIQSKVGWDQLVQNEIQSNHTLSEKLATLPPAQGAKQRQIMQLSFRGGFYAGPVLTLAFVALAALVLWGTINFGFGGTTTFGRTFTMAMYAGLPLALSSLLGAVMLFAGRSPETFTRESMLGSNPGYYIDTPGPLKTFLTSLDVFTIWNLVLLSIGLAIVARTKRSTGYIAVFGWFVVIVLFRTAMAAVSS